MEPRQADREILDYSYLDYEDIVSPIDPDLLEQLLLDTDFEIEKRRKLVNGFREGFELGYQGPLNRKDTSDNLSFMVGDSVDLWLKVMKEVKLGRYVGPFLESDIPYQYYVQSPVGLVPKAGGKT